MRVILIVTTFFIIFFVLVAGGMALLVDKRQFSPNHTLYSVQQTAVNLLTDAPSGSITTATRQAQTQEQAQQRNTPTGITPASVPFLQDIDHSFFVLDGGHAIECEMCHSEGTFANTPALCSQCHQPPTDHYAGECDDCHDNANWEPIAFDHVGLTECTSCHVDDAPSPHYTGDCILCHNSNNWEEATFTHDGLTDCLSCHTEVAPVNHYPGQCSACHNTNNWQEVTFSHAGLTNCLSCHAEPDVHAGQFGTDCARCHLTTAWTPAQLLNHTFPLNHENNGNIDCVTCHERTYAEYTCYGCHEHTPANIASEHREEGITNFENCVECHPTGREDEAEDDD